MTVTVPKIRSAAAMDVDISVCLHIKVFVIMCGSACSPCVVFFFFVIVFLLCLSAGPAKPGVCPRKNLGVAVSGVCRDVFP